MNTGHVEFSTNGDVTRRSFSGPVHAIGPAFATALHDHFGEHADAVLASAVLAHFDEDTKLTRETVAKAIDALSGTLERLCDDAAGTD